MRLCLLQEIMNTCPDDDQVRSSRCTQDDLVEDVTQLLRQSRSMSTNFCPSVITVYATAIAISVAHNTCPSRAEAQVSNSRMRSLALLQSLQDLSLTWAFARQVFSQLTIRKASGPNTRPATPQRHVDNDLYLYERNVQNARDTGPQDLSSEAELW